MHGFWRETDEQLRSKQMAHFMKNRAMAGGALLLFYAYNQLQEDAGCRSRIRSLAAAEGATAPLIPGVVSSLAYVTFVETQISAGHPPHAAMNPTLPAVLGSKTLLVVR
jgi:hypothetical protein